MTKPPAASRFLSYLAGAGAIGEDILRFDWASTPLGPIETWPLTLRATIRTALTTQQPINFFWGPDLRQFYNEACLSFMGERTSDAIGAPFYAFWAEVAEDVRPLVEQALSGTGCGRENLPLVMTRNGRTEETFWTFSYSPLFDDDGEISGFINIVNETTATVRAEERARTELARLSEMFQQSPSFMAILRGSDHRFEFVNPAYLQVIGHRDVVGRTVADILPDAVRQGYLDLLQEVYRTGEVYRATSAKYAVQAEIGGPVVERYVDFVFQPIKALDETTTGILVVGFDVTDRIEAARELAESEAFLRGILNSSSDCIKVLDIDARLIFMSEGGQRVMEVADFGAIKGCPWPDFWKQDGNLAAREAVAAAAKGIAGSFQGYAETMAGNRKYWDVQVAPIFGADGKPERILAVSRDISALKNAEIQRGELIQEMSHRQKNSLAIVQAIVAQSFRQAKTIEQGRDAIAGRIAALAAAQDVLTATEWATSNIAQVIDAALAPHRDGSDRFVLNGPAVELSQQQALGLSLAMHELATNAAKYGALSSERGRVEIAWAVGPGRAFQLSWTEHGGPPVVQPERRGFGSRLVERMVAPYFQGTTELQFRPEGVAFRLDGTIGGDVADPRPASGGERHGNLIDGRGFSANG